MAVMDKSQEPWQVVAFSAAESTSSGVVGLIKHVVELTVPVSPVVWGSESGRGIGWLLLNGNVCACCVITSNPQILSASAKAAMISSGISSVDCWEAKKGTMVEVNMALSSPRVGLPMDRDCRSSGRESWLETIADAKYGM